MYPFMYASGGFRGVSVVSIETPFVLKIAYD
jgi:hypothetical protein